MATPHLERPWGERIASGAGAILLPAAALLGLWFAGGPTSVPAVQPSITAISLPPDPPPPEPEPDPPPPPEIVTQPAPKPLAQPEPEGGAAPPNLRSRAAPIVAPNPIVPRFPTEFAAAPIPAAGTDSTSGASDIAGPGTGAGGVGDGFGSGRGGDGTGGGGGGTVPAVEARKVAGRIRDRERPPGTDESVSRRVVGVNFTILPTGRVTGCTVAESSGDPALDRFTCRKIEERWRYRPARDRYGRAVKDEQGWYQIYTFDGSDPTLPGR